MAEQTAIEWCDATLNLWWGCTKVSDGCKHCYAETLTNRFGGDNWGPKGTRLEVKSWRSTLEKISKRAKAEGKRLRVFVQSMSDTFEGPETMGGVESVNWATVRHLQTQLFSEILGRRELDFLLLTKRPENVLPALRRHFGSTDSDAYPNKWFEKCPNVWIGTSVEDQKAADERIPHLLKIPAAVRFLSCEPLLGLVDLTRFLYADCDWCEGAGYSTGCTLDPQDEEDCANCEGSGIGDDPLDEIHWVICGGESGPQARPMALKWARDLRDQCQSAGVPFFFKQWGEFTPTVQFEAGNFVERELMCRRVGKKTAGRLLDGREWSEFPKEDIRGS